MKNAFVMWKKEILGYFFSPIAYLFMVVFLVASVLAMLVLGDFFFNNRADLRGFFEHLPYLYVLLVPALTMRLWSEERKQGTIEILLTLPMREWEILTGKFAAALSVLLLTLFLTFPLPIVVASIGNLDWGPVVGGYFASALLGAAYIAVGIFVSGLTRNQIISFIGTAVILCLFVAIGHPVVVRALDASATRVFYHFGVSFGFLPHFESVCRGVIYLKDMVYFVTFSAVFLVMNRYSIEVHRYS